MTSRPTYFLCTPFFCLQDARVSSQQFVIEKVLEDHQDGAEPGAWYYRFTEPHAAYSLLAHETFDLPKPPISWHLNPTPFTGTE
eukprot:4022776-Amphidinium_carterae.1